MEVKIHLGSVYVRYAHGAPWHVYHEDIEGQFVIAEPPGETVYRDDEALLAA